MRTALVSGGGLGGAGAAMSLMKFGWSVRVERMPPRQGKPIALNGASQFLIERLWGSDLLASLARHRLARRVIAWRPGEVHRIDEPTVVADSAAMAQLMAERLAEAGAREPDGEPPDWTITGSSRGRRLTGGARRAGMIEVELSETADREALLIEAAPAGWLALLPMGHSRAMLFGFAPGRAASVEALRELLAGAPLTRRSIMALVGEGSLFDAVPRLGFPPFGEEPGLFVGEAAIALDPLSGDGAATALRTGHLAASMAEAHAQGAGIDEVRDFFARRLARAMGVHLQGLLVLYGDAPFRARWTAETAALRGMAAEIGPLADAPEAPAFTISEQGARAASAA